MYVMKERVETHQERYLCVHSRTGFVVRVCGVEVRKCSRSMKHNHSHNNISFPPDLAPSAGQVASGSVVDRNLAQNGNLSDSITDVGLLAQSGGSSCFKKF